MGPIMDDTDSVSLPSASPRDDTLTCAGVHTMVREGDFFEDELRIHRVILHLPSCPRCRGRLRDFFEDHGSGVIKLVLERGLAENMEGRHGRASKLRVLLAEHLTPTAR